MEKELVKSEHWRLLCDGKIHWVVPTEKGAQSAGNARIEAGGCICEEKGVGGRVLGVGNEPNKN